eukprot:616856_1
MGSVSSTKLTFDSDDPETFLHRKDFNELYELGEEIGVGSFASVHRCFRRSDSKEFAVKNIKKDYLTERELIGLRDEIQILRKTSHRNIITLIDVFDDGRLVSMVLELCDGKDLFDEIVSSAENRFSEAKAAEITLTLSTSLQYLHDNGVVHRDLKPENILYALDGTLRITDFGLAHYTTDLVEDTVAMETCCGTPHYVAPEIITKNKYNHKCDLWSLGVILYIMLVGYQPFNASSLNQIYELISKGKYELESTRWNCVSKEAKQLVKGLLEVDPNKRYSAREIKYNPWIIKHANRDKPHQA